MSIAFADGTVIRKLNLFSICTLYVYKYIILMPQMIPKSSTSLRWSLGVIFLNDPFYRANLPRNQCPEDMHVHMDTYNDGCVLVRTPACPSGPT